MSGRTRKILSFASWLGMIFYLICGLTFATNRADEVICNGVEVNVKDSVNYRFVTSAMIRRMMTEAGKMPIGIPINSVNTKILEDNVASMVAVRDVQVYKQMNGIIRIDVRQRTPIVRVFNANNQSYYIDNEGRVMPTSSNFSARVLVVTGNIREPFIPKVNVDVMQWADSLYHAESPLICQILQLSRFIASNEFWNAQIEQVYVESPDNIMLIPTVGPHTIMLGGVSGYASKLKKLKKFYTRALPYEGWNRYKTINLKYSNQIICTKR